jgi:hypothetical protein
MHALTALLPQSSDSDGLPFSAQHEVQQLGNAEDEGTALQGEDDTGATELLEPDGYGTADHDDETGDTGTLLLGTLQ